MSSLKVKINIAGRQYPLTINANEEEAVRNAGKEINKLIKDGFTYLIYRIYIFISEIGAMVFKL